VTVNPVTGRILLERHSLSSRRAPEWVASEDLIGDALATPPLDQDAWLEHGTKRSAGKARKLLTKLMIGGSKLLLIFSNRLIWGALAASPIVMPVMVLSITGTVITGYDFLRAFIFTVTGRKPITTGTLIGAATLSSLMLRENVTALIVLWLLNLGEYLEILTLRRTRRAIRQLLSMEDDEVCLLREGVEVSVRANSVEVDDLVVVRAGRRIAVDGVIDEGKGAVNEAPITGENMPVSRGPGDSVYAGTVLLSGALTIRVTGVGLDTVVGHLIQRVEQAQTLKPRIQTVGDAFAKKVVPSSFAAALLVFLVTRDPRRALTMMLVACPCAAGLATPTAVSASIGNGARRGILIKGGTYIEAMAGIDTVCFDKTGTLTESLPTISRIVPLSPQFSAEQILQMAARAERHSQHPLAVAILEQAAGNSRAYEDFDDEFEILAGRGVRIWNDEDEILVGNERLLEEYEVVMPAEAAELEKESWAAAETLMYIAFQRGIVGAIAVSALVRTQAIDAILQLQTAGVNRLMMLTGDSEPVAQFVANQVGVTAWRSRLMPHDKFDVIQELRGQGRKVAMVGDGINDAPALALANVGIAMGTAGSDVAIEAADIALAADDLRSVSSVLTLSRQAMSVIRQNYGLALGTNSIGLYLAAVGSINPIIAAVLHNLSTILVIGNSTRLIHFDPTGRGQRDVYSLGSAGQSQCSEHDGDSGCCAHSGPAHSQKENLEQHAAQFGRGEHLKRGHRVTMGRALASG
jgi:cation-transporting P-type ATPase C